MTRKFLCLYIAPLIKTCETMKKLLTLLLAFGFTLAFVACSNTAKTGETAVEEAVEETAETTEEAVEEVTEEVEGTTEEVTEEVVEEADTTAQESE